MFWGPILRSYFCMNDGNDKTFSKLNLLPPNEVSLPSVGVAPMLTGKGRLWSLVRVGLALGFSQSVQSCLTLCNPMDCSMPGLPVHHHLLEFTQTHVHRVDDAIQPSHPLSSPSPPAPNPSQHQSFFQWVNSSHEVARVLEFQLQHQSFQWTPRADLL